MKAIFGGLLIAAALAVAAGAVLNDEFQRTARDAFQTSGVRL